MEYVVHVLPIDLRDYNILLSRLVWSLPLRMERKGLEQCIYQTHSAVQKY